MCRWIGSAGGSPSTTSRRDAGPETETGSGGEAGFTLIEVLVAFAVLAIVMVPLLQVFGDGLGTTQTARAYARATMLARSKLAEIGVDEPLEEGEQTGSFDEPGFLWRTRITPDVSEVIAPPPPPGARDRRRSRDSDRSATGAGTGSRTGRSGSSFGQSRDSSFGDGDSGFGRGGSGFGSRSRSGSAGLGDSRSSGFGQGSSSRSSAFGQGRSGTGSVGSRGGGAGGLDEDEDLSAEPTLLLYRVVVTVEWGRNAANSLTLSTLRARRPSDGVGDEDEGAGSAGRGTDGGGDRGGNRGRERTSSFGRDRGSGGSGSGFGSRTGSGSSR